MARARELETDYLPIAEHGLVGDLHTVALVGTNATIDWYCCPSFDAPSVFGAILDKDNGGFYALRPTAEEWEANEFPDSVFKRMGELGFLGLDKPAEYGGQGGDYFSAIVLGEEMAGAACGGMAMGIAAQTDMAMPPILAFGTEEQKQQWAVPAIAGEKILCLGISEPNAGSDVAAITTRAERRGDRWVLRGTKTWVTSAPVADMLTICAKTSKERGMKHIALFLVDRQFPGVTLGKQV